MSVVKIKYFGESSALYGKRGACPATGQACGLDLRACFAEDTVCIEPGDRYPVPTGIAIEICEKNIAAFLYSRSGWGAKKGLTIAQGVGVIDPDFRGEIIAYMLNTSNEAVTVERGDRIAQLVFHPYVPVSTEESAELTATERGIGGYGHTGNN